MQCPNIYNLACNRIFNVEHEPHMHFNGKRILVPVDGSTAADNAFRWACQIAKHSKAELHAIYIDEIPLELPLDTHFTGEDNIGEHILNDIEQIADEEKCKVKAQLLKARHIGPAIVLEAADREMEMIILGAPFQNTVSLNSISNLGIYLLQHAHCQVIIWRENLEVAPLSA